jgi:tetratricopeptide (TPR) repeat protein
VKRWFPVLVLGLGLAAPAPRAHATDIEAVREARALLQEGVDQGRADLALQARDRFAALAATEPDVALLHYWTAVAGWRAFPLLPRAKSKAAAEATLDHAMDAVHRAIALDPRLADAIALEAGLTGMRVQLGGMTEGMTLGPVMGKLEDQAKALAPANPRVRFLAALNTLHKPGFVGGGARKALPLFEAAIAAFAAETPGDGLQPDWGRDDAHLWAGRAAAELKDWAKAREHFDRALELNPRNEWAKQQLADLDEKSRGSKKG